MGSWVQIRNEIIMRRKSLVHKLIIRFTSILTFVTVLIAIVLSVWFKDFFLQQKRQELESKTQIVATAALSHMKVEQPDSLKDLQSVINLVGNSIDTDIIITDKMGIAYAVSNAEYDPIKLKKIDISDETMDKLKAGNSIEYSNNTILGHEKCVGLNPIMDGERFNGIIVMINSEYRIKEAMLQVYKIVWLLALLGIMLSVIIINYFAKKILINPLSELNNAANKLAKGEVHRRVEIKSEDEIGELGKSFNIMAESLEKVEKNRRDFISNVSHELRSPITSIKGFLAGIIDGVIPKDKEDYYLNIVYDEVKRLSRLVADLLDISAMEDGKFKLNKIEIDINVLLKLCLVNLEGKIRKKNIDVEVSLENDHQFVYGDRDRIIQVITNLIDNAVKYCKEDGLIKIDTTVKGNKVYISIYNNGPLLSDEEIRCIWNRFYKADKSRTNKESTGLGLPIVRLILTQHGEDIWVKNEKDGVKFIFTLQTI